MMAEQTDADIAADLEVDKRVLLPDIGIRLSEFFRRWKNIAIDSQREGKRCGRSFLNDMLLGSGAAILRRHVECPMRAGCVQRYRAVAVEPIKRRFLEFLQRVENIRAIAHDGRREDLLGVRQTAELAAQFDPDSGF